jgi:hypothetical protein
MASVPFGASLLLAHAALARMPANAIQVFRVRICRYLSRWAMREVCRGVVACPGRGFRTVFSRRSGNRLPLALSPRHVALTGAVPVPLGARREFPLPSWPLGDRARGVKHWGYDRLLCPARLLP